MLYFLSHYQLVIRNAECIFLSVLIFFLSKGLGFAQFCNSFKTSQLKKQSPSFKCTHRPICFFPLKIQMLVNHQIVQYQPVIKSKQNVFPLKKQHEQSSEIFATFLLFRNNKLYQIHLGAELLCLLSEELFWLHTYCTCY